ncbi:MAG TPA: hypothetical protein VGK00_03755 [Anaerolineales bacterium]|jgi:hypothetical protein
MIELLKTNRGFRIATILVAGQALVMTILAVLRVGGEQFINGIFDYSSPIFAAISTLAAYWGWSISNPKEVSRRIWGWMTTALILWTVAEALWIYYSFIYQDTTPYPSPADFFWLLGYFPLYASLILRVRSFHVGLNRQQTRMLVIVNSLFLIFSAHSILWPMLQNADPSRWLESLVNIFYALGDLGLLALSLWIIIALQNGRYSSIWLLVAGSNVIRAIADLIFTYATWHDATLTEASFYIIYVIFNIPYLTAYLLSALGMVAYYFFIEESRQAEQVSPETVNPDFGTALIFTNSDNVTIATSDNFKGLTGEDFEKEIKGRPLHELLGVEPGVVDGMMQAGRKTGIIKDYPLEMHTPGQAEKVLARVTATADRSDGVGFNGLNIALRMESGNIPAWAELDTQSRAIARRIMKDTGQLSQDNISLLKKYFRAVVLGLFELVDRLAGQAVSHTMLEHFNSASSGKSEIRLDQHRLLIPDNLKEEQLANAFRELLQTTNDFAVEILSAQVVAAETKKIELQLSQRIVLAARDFGLRDL